MIKRSSIIRTLGIGITWACVIVFVASVIILISSIIETQGYVTYSSLESQFRDIQEFQRHILILWILFIIQVVGLLAIFAFKPWGRWTVIGTSTLIYLQFLHRMTAQLKELELTSFLIMAFYILTIIFFSLPRVKNHLIFLSKRKKILIVDDDKGLLRVLATNLIASGYAVDTAGTGEKGLEAAGKTKPDLIILDVILPGIKGRDVCARLKKDPLTSHIPVIFLTSKNSPDDIKAEMDVGGLVHLLKPIDFPVVLKEIKKVLGE